MDPNLESGINNLVDEFRTKLHSAIQTYVHGVIEHIMRDGLVDFNNKSSMKINLGAPIRGRGRRSLNAPLLAAQRGGKRDPKIMAETVSQLATYISKNPGSRMIDIAPALNSTSKELMLPMQKLLAERRVSKKGEKSATKYFPKQS